MKALRGPQLKRLENRTHRDDSRLTMKSQLTAIVAAVLVVGCGNPDRALFQAVKDINIEAAKQAIADGADVNAKGLYGPGSYELGVYLVGAAEMVRANWEYLRHEGSTDVITLDYGEADAAPKSGPIVGDIFICPVVAEEFARKLGTSWAEEVARYLIHGILHLRGYDDSAPGLQRTMKREENRLMQAAAKRFPLSRLARGTKVVRR
jgi:probable rRNA maturation factor